MESIGGLKAYDAIIGELKSTILVVLWTIQGEIVIGRKYDGEDISIGGGRFGGGGVCWKNFLGGGSAL